MKKIMLIIIAGVLLLSTACQAPAEEKEDENTEVATTTETVFEKYENLVEAGAASDELGIFIGENIDKVSQSEAEAMIEALVIEQQQSINEMNGLIYKPEYMVALNTNMNGILVPDLIPSIENEEVRAGYQALSDGYLTIIRYEESPNVETDWESINSLGEYFSDDFREMTYLFDKIQSYKYNRTEPDFKTIYADAVKAEELITKNDISFLTWQLDRLYDLQIGNLLIGPEGSYIEAFISKEGQPYQSLVESSKEYPQAEISKLVMELDEGQDNDLNKVSSLITNYNTFGLKSPAKVVLGIGGLNDAIDTQDIMYVSIEDNPDAEFKINNAINDAILELKNSMETENGVSVRNMIMFANGNYLNMIITAYRTDESGSMIYKENEAVLDMESGESLSISELLETPWTKLKGELESLTGKEIKEEPSYSIGRIGIEIHIPREGSEFYDYLAITYDDVAKFVPLDRFYK